MGGILGQEILKAVSRKGEPALNCFVWDGDSHEGRTMRLPPVVAAQGGSLVLMPVQLMYLQQSKWNPRKVGGCWVVWEGEMVVV